jgi:hypothetical protein
MIFLTFGLACGRRTPRSVRLASRTIARMPFESRVPNGVAHEFGGREATVSAVDSPTAAVSPVQ